MPRRARSITVALPMFVVAACGALGSTLANASSAPSPNLVATTSDPSRTTVPDRSTTTTSEPVRPTEPTPPDRPTTTPAPTTTAPAATTTTPAAPSSTTTAPVTTPPATATPPASPPPITTPPTQVETAAQIVTAPPPDLLPPVIAFVSATCAGPNALDGAVSASVIVPPENWWLYGHAVAAAIDWALSLDGTVVDDGSLSVGKKHAELAASFLGAGIYELVVRDAVFPSLADTVDVTVPSCGVAEPFPPTLELVGFWCPDINTALATIGNPGGDDGSDRTYDVSLVDSNGGTIQFLDETIADGSWVEFIFDGVGGAYTLTVFDLNVPTLSTSVTFDLPPCGSPGPPPDPQPLLAPVIIGVATECASANSGLASIVVADPNLGNGPVPPSPFEYTVGDGSAVVGSGVGIAAPVKNVAVDNLFAGTYDVTVIWQFESTSMATTSFVIPACAFPAVPPTEVEVSVLWSTCDPIVVSQTLLSVWHPVIGPAESFTWYLWEGADVIRTGGFDVEGGEAVLIGQIALAAGDYELTTFTDGPSDLGGSVPFTVPPCALPDDPADPADPVDPVDPVDPTAPPAAGESPAADGSVAPASVPLGGSLPATGSSAVATLAVAALVLGLGSVILVGVRRRPDRAGSVGGR